MSEGTAFSDLPAGEGVRGEHMAMVTAELRGVSPDKIDPNPDNPRLIFREAELNQLLESIDEVGIQVPLSVYRDGRRFTLIDGERRWRCAKKLNLTDVPCLVQPKPDKLQNLLTMFNIHNVRRDWDLMPTAIKLGEVRGLLLDAGQPARPGDLAGITGMTLPTVRRALELLELPRRYQDLLLREASKPRDQQSVTADVFVEVNKSKRVIERYLPQVFEQVSPEEYVDAMVSKYSSGVITNVVRFRDISRIARAERAGEDPEEVVPYLVELVKNPSYSIEDAFRDTVQTAYESRDIGSRAASLIDRLHAVRNRKSIPREVRSALGALREEIDRLLGRA